MAVTILSGRNRPVQPLAVVLAIPVPLLLQMLPSALAQPAEGTLGNQVDTLLRAFPGGLTPNRLSRTCCLVFFLLEDAVIIGIKYVTQPGEQFVIRREAYQRILRDFKANGINPVGRGVVVRVGDAQDGERTIGVVAAQAIRSVFEDKARAD
jgi:small-conductance mechanosensitive channel